VGEPSDSIVVNNADEVKETAVNVDQGLKNALSSVTARVALQYANELLDIELATVPDALQALLDQVSPRIAAQYANVIHHIEMTALPGTLQALLDQVSSRVAVQYGNLIRHIDLPALPDALQTRLEEVSDRIVIQYANTNRQEALVYPLELLDDTAAPQITDIGVTPVGSGSVNITWTTNEFATSAVYYGTQPGEYPNTIDDSYYTKQHTVGLSDLTPHTTYYFLVSSTDQSGNTATSAEQSFSTAMHIAKSVAPRGQVDYGDELTYSVVISSMLEAEAGFYDPLGGVSFVHFVEQPGDVTYDNGAITGTLTIPSEEVVTVSFVVHVGVPGTAGWTIDVTNRACVYPTGGTLEGDCTWSNKVTNEAFRPYGVYLPLVVRNR
jgi:hypothetical protein